jgi:hypothetical protein
MYVLYLLAVSVAGAFGFAKWQARGSHNIEGKGWSAGPKLRGTERRDYSDGVTLDPNALPSFIVPQLPQSVHAITKDCGSLSGKTQIRMVYRVDMAPGASLDALSVHGAPTMICLHFQRKGDDWSTNGKYETYRWYAGFAMTFPITAGEHELVAPFSGNWGATQTSMRETNPTAFQAALENACRVGFTLGGGDGIAHGIYAIGGVVRITVLSFEIT